MECIQKDAALAGRSVDSVKEIKLANVDELSQHTNNTLTKCQNIMVTAKSILSSKSDWTVIQASEDILVATNSLLRDTGCLTEYDEDFKLPCLNESKLMLTKTFCVKSSNLRNWSYISSSITGNGNIVVSGMQLDSNYSGIIVFNEDGVIRKEKYFQHIFPSECYRVCTGFGKFKIASICPPDEVSILDIRNDLCLTKKLRKCKHWKKNEMVVECIAADGAKSRIIVGCKHSRDLFLLDERLTICQLITLPNIIEWPWEMAVSGEEIFVCDNAGKRAFAVTMEGKLVIEFKKPDSKLRNPSSVCVDQDGHVFLIWATHGVDILAKYNRKTGQILTSETIEENSVGIQICNTSRQCKLYLVTVDTNNNIKVSVYHVLCRVEF